MLAKPSQWEFNLAARKDTTGRIFKLIEDRITPLFRLLTQPANLYYWSGGSQDYKEASLSALSLKVYSNHLPATVRQSSVSKTSRTFPYNLSLLHDER